MATHLVNCAYYLGYQPVFKVRTLMQLGYEPVPPRATTTIFGRRAFALPGLFDYTKILYKAEGLSGIYAGFPARYASEFLYVTVASAVSTKLKAVRRERSAQNEKDVSQDILGEPSAVLGIPMEDVRAFLTDTADETVGRVVACAVAHPLQLLAVRTAAQFVGKESVYGALGLSVREVLRDEGVLGLFGGLVPRILGEVLACWAVACATFFINRAVVKDKEMEKLTHPVVSIVVGSVLYPFNLVTTCMMVSGAGLAAARPPYMPTYGSWVDCWRHLAGANELKRGSSFFFRNVSLNKNFMPMPLPMIQ